MNTPNFPIENAENNLYSIGEIRSIEKEAQHFFSHGELMQAAGAVAVNLAASLLTVEPSRVLILVGPGNNGGDALEVAHLLSQTSHEIHILLCADSANFSKEAKQAYLRAENSRVIWHSFTSTLCLEENTWGLIIDGLFGIGLYRTLSSAYTDLIARVNSLTSNAKIPVLALDVPSCLDADTGQFTVNATSAICATHTITFIGNKPGLHTGKGRDYAGKVTVSDLNIDKNLFPNSLKKLTSKSSISSIFKRRSHDSHKGKFGDVLIIGGEIGMQGAALLAGRAALYSGAGRVHIGFISYANQFDSIHPELMCHAVSLEEIDQKIVIIGPGLGTSTAAKNHLNNCLTDCQKIVVDADALNLIAQDISLQQLVIERHEKNFSTIMTPHPLEAARLLNITLDAIQNNRCDSAQQLAQKYNATIILKGSGSIIATADHKIWINTTGNPGLATAGTGDVLAGICGALLAQNISTIDAARAAVWLHGAAADYLVENNIGPIGLTASEIIPAARFCLNSLVE
jgi:ADP-dependent NAD(P)H-hydrate dehydratase / NAD(P)H-hydrate epimerase